MMSFVGLLKAAAASSKTAKLIDSILIDSIKVNGVKGVFTIMDVIDTAVDAGQLDGGRLDADQLGDEIASAMMGEDASPALRELAQAVAAAGVAFDQKMQAVADAYKEITHLSAGIDSLAQMHIHYGDRALLVTQTLEKLDALKTQLQTTSPATYTWFSTLKERAANEVPNMQQLDAMKKVLDPDMARISIHSGLLGFRAVYVGYSQYKKHKRSGKELRREHSNAFSGGDVATMKRAQAVAKRDQQRLKSRAKTIGKVAFKGSTQLVTAGSFGMNIYLLISMAKQHSEAMEGLRKMRDRFQKETPFYEQVLNGVPRNDAAALQRFAEFFDLDVSRDSVKESLYAGYRGTVDEYESMMVTLLGKEENSATANINAPDISAFNITEADGIEGAYTAMMGKFEETQVLQSEQAVVDKLRASHQKVKCWKAIALNTGKRSEVRKEEGLEPIKKEFVAEVSSQLDHILATLDVQMDDHRSLNMLMTSARKLNCNTSVESKIQEIKRKFPEASDELLQFLLDKVLDGMEGEKKQEAQTMLGILDVAVPKRSQFKTLAAIEAGLGKIMRDLPVAAQRAAVAMPLEQLPWMIEGPGETAVKADLEASSVSYDYALSGPSVWTRQTWMYYAQAPASRVISFEWVYSGFHAWCRPFVKISAFVDGENGREYSTLLEGTQREGEGQAQLQINQGEAFGFIIKGSNFDRDSRLLGTLKVDFKG